MKDIEIDFRGLCSVCFKKGRKKSCAKTCCLVGVYERIKKPTMADIIAECCIKRCMHDPYYHEHHCPISLAGVNKDYPLNPNLKEKLEEWEERLREESQ